MVVCSFFQQGRCKFGASCKYEHPVGGSAGTSKNRFGVVGTNQPNTQNQKPPDLAALVDNIQQDLNPEKGRPQWILSAYAPSKDVPCSLFSNYERSVEEMRLRHYELAAAGNMNQALQEASNLWMECEQHIAHALKNSLDAAKYVTEGQNGHANHFSNAHGRAGGILGQAPSPFSQPPASSQPSPFGQQNANLTPNAGPASGGFGAPSSTFGQKTGFGQPSGFGAPQPSKTPAFGQPSVFGQPSSMGPTGFGQPSTGGSGFGQTSALGQQSAFNKPAFGQPSLGQPAGANTNPFGKPAASGGSLPFGAPSTASPFARASNNQSATGGFGQSSGPPGPSPFGQTAAKPPAAPFGTQPTSSGFGQPSQLQPAQPTNPFGAPTQQPAAPSPFGLPTQPPSAAMPFGQLAGAEGVTVQRSNTGPNAFIKTDMPNVLNPLPPLQGETRVNPQTKRLTMWKGRPVSYINEKPCYLHPQDNKTFVRIHFYDGPPDAATLKTSQGKPEEYTPDVVEAYQFFLQNGHFKDGKIPAVPPQREWINYDF